MSAAEPRLARDPVRFRLVDLRRLLGLAGLAVLAAAGPAGAQPKSVTLPPDGDNQRATVIQRIGLVSVSVDYSSPDVHGPSGEDRAGKIWGELVPFGMANLGFGTCGDQCPWRGGANENTVFTTSHPIEVQGQALPAGSYGLHFVPGEAEWTVVFSHDSTAWGSFFYDAQRDALRVTAKPEKGPYREWLTYEFTDRRPDRATLALAWENLQLPMTITVPGATDLWVEQLRRELRSNPGFQWQGWRQAANYCLQQKTNLEEALGWAQNAVSMPFIGQENFQTLSTLASLQEANGKTAESKATRDRALNHPTAGPIDLHQYGRSLIGEKKAAEALAVFQLNAKRHPGVWPVEVGLMRGYAAVGNHAEALKHARIAVTQAPDPGNRQNLERLVKLLEEGKDIN
jgi:hypothetical protein